MIAILIKYWKPIAVVLLVIAMFFTGWHEGVLRYKAAAEVALNKAIEQQQKDHDALQKKLDAQSADYIKKIAAAQTASNDLERKLDAERKKKNYIPCRVDADGVQLYNASLPGAAAHK